MASDISKSQLRDRATAQACTISFSCLSPAQRRSHQVADELIAFVLEIALCLVSAGGHVKLACPNIRCPVEFAQGGDIAEIDIAHRLRNAVRQRLAATATPIRRLPAARIAS